MNVEIQKFVDEQKELYKTIKKINTLIEAYKQVEDTEMPNIDKYNAQKDAFNKRINSIDTLINAYQSLCTHTHPNGDDAMMYEAHDSHKDYYSCVICGEQTSI